MSEPCRKRATLRQFGIATRVTRRAERAAGKRKESAGKPGSVVGNHSSGTHVAVSLKRPTRKRVRITLRAPSTSMTKWGPRRLPYLVLLQVGFAVPLSVATSAVRSYRTVSPLPAFAVFTEKT